MRIIQLVTMSLFTLVAGVFWGTWFILSRSIASITPAAFLEIGHTMIGNLGGPMSLLIPATILSTPAPVSVGTDTTVSETTNKTDWAGPTVLDYGLGPVHVWSINGTRVARFSGSEPRFAVSVKDGDHPERIVANDLRSLRAAFEVADKSLPEPCSSTNKVLDAAIAAGLDKLPDPLYQVKKVMPAEVKEKLRQHVAAKDEGKPAPTGTCLCGCGGTTKSRFAPGHDAKLKGKLRRRYDTGLLDEAEKDLIKSLNWGRLIYT